MGQSGWSRSDFWFPTPAILAAPQSRGSFILDDPMRFGIKADGVTGAVSDISEMAEQRAFVAFLDISVRRLAVPDAIQKILVMR